jgi:hypothetical protein
VQVSRFDDDDAIDVHSASSSTISTAAVNTA